MSSLILTSLDVARFRSVSATLFEHDSADEPVAWARELLGCTSAYLGAPRAAIAMPRHGTLDGVVLNLDVEAIRVYAAYYHRFDFGAAGGHPRRPVRGATGTSILYRGRMQDYFRSEYFYDYHRPRRMFSGVALMPGLAAEPTLYAWFDHQRAEDDDQRSIAMLQLLEPAFRASVERQRRPPPLPSRIIGEIARVQTGRRPPLTRREAQVAELLACRWSNAEIARHLGVSGHTARHHTERVLSKLGLTSRRDVPAPRAPRDRRE